jgi:hypothetical protein
MFKREPTFEEWCRGDSSDCVQVRIRVNYMGWGNSRAPSGQLAAMTWWVICGQGSHIDRHAGREIALGIVRRIRPWWNLRRHDRGELEMAQ